jgi:hypothetical protein
MKAFNQIISGETGTVLLNLRRITKDLKRGLCQNVFTIFLAIFLLMILVPANASTAPAKNIKSECRHKITSFTYPIIKANKKSSGYNKNINKSKKRKHSFPV